MEDKIRISHLAEELGVSTQYIRMLEWQGRIPPARRDLNGRIYSEFDVALLKALGIGSRPRRLKSPAEVLEKAG
jgi:DNA-binding transcriptional MerR regulator